MKKPQTIRNRMNELYAYAQGRKGDLNLRGRRRAYERAVALQWVVEKVSWPVTDGLDGRDA